jgi:hypothetical protein
MHPDEASTVGFLFSHLNQVAGESCGMVEELIQMHGEASYAQ